MGVDLVTDGPPAASQVVGAQGTILDQKNNVLYTFGNAGTAVPLVGAAATLTLTGQTTATSATAGAATALPATPLGYLSVNVNGVAAKIPYYAV